MCACAVMTAMFSFFDVYYYGKYHHPHQVYRVMNNLFFCFFFGTVHEYCQWEHFNVTCPEGSLIVMESAHYGRMRIGRCIDSEYQVGCAADVLTMLDGRCSGRPSCQILLPDSVLHKQQPCNKDMMAYLEASYTCIAGEILTYGVVTSS